MPWLFAHGLHLLLVVLGLAGVAMLLLPQLRTASVPGPTAAAAGTTRTARDSSTWRALAVSSSVAAAGVHAAVFPHHLEESFLVGTFFLAVTLGQAGWACLVFLAASRERLVAGIVANLGLVVLWGVSRTVGLPFLGREAVGGWDLAAGAWELVLVAACLVGLRRSADDRGLVLGRFGRVAFVWAVLSGVGLVLLTLTVAQH